MQFDTNKNKNFCSSHWELVKNSNDENEDPYSLIQHCVNYHTQQSSDNDIVYRVFENYVNGVFLNCGSNNGNDQSFQLLEKGWHGVYVEADPSACVDLLKITKPFSNHCTIINAAVSTEKKLQTFNLSNTNSYSSIKKQWIENHNNQCVRQIWTNTITLTEVLALFDYNFDYIQTDLEGIDIEVIESVDWNMVKTCKLICTEAGPAVLKHLCQQADFIITDITPTNTYYMKKFVINDTL